MSFFDGDEVSGPYGYDIALLHPLATTSTVKYTYPPTIRQAYRQRFKPAPDYPR